MKHFIVPAGGARPNQADPNNHNKLKKRRKNI